MNVAVFVHEAVHLKLKVHKYYFWYVIEIPWYQVEFFW